MWSVRGRMRWMFSLMPLAFVASHTSCAQHAPAPLAEALFVVDTDLAVPQLAARLRVDLYSESGVWYESRDIGRPQAADWPASFSVFSPLENREQRVLVRLRAYPEGVVRDYRGERFADRGGPPADGPTSDDIAPRLVKEGRDITPGSEPKPSATVDRLVVVRIRPGVRGRVRITLRGACAGSMALLGHAPPYQKVTMYEAETCIDTEGQRAHPAEELLEEDMSVPPANQLGSFGRAKPCTLARGSDPRAECIEGGAFLMGSEGAVGFNTAVDPVPERVQKVDTFYLDRKEVTVGQLRAALAAGFKPPAKLIAHEGKLGVNATGDAYPLDHWCTYSAQPRGREDFPINCADRRVAHDYCEFVGGALPSEAQWEFAAGVAGKKFKSEYPWGDESPSCDRAVYGRAPFFAGSAIDCPDQPPGPTPVGATELDATPAGILDLGGNVAELVLDELADFGAPCWLSAPLTNPVCRESNTALHALRGGAFIFDAFGANVALRNDDGTESVRATFGFRCAFAEPPGHE